MSDPARRDSGDPPPIRDDLKRAVLTLLKAGETVEAITARSGLSRAAVIAVIEDILGG